MFESKKVTLESKLTVVSSKPVRSGMSHTLSALDHAMGFHTLHIIYYYLNLDNWYGSFELDPLRHSLSEVLSAYPTMTGRLARGVDDNDHWEVKCNDAGVRVIKANVDTTLMEWLSSASSSDEALLISWEDMPHHPNINIWSPFRIQINRFKEGGVAIGLSCSHMVADLTSAASFFKSWTETHRHVPLSHPPFFTTPSPLVNSFARHCRRTTLMSSSKTILTTPSTNMSTATFKFASSAIKKCLSKLQNDNVTPFEFLSALFWTSIAQLKHATKTTTHHHQYSLSICNDLRSLIKLPIGNYFGNALHFSKISLNVEDVKSDEIVEMASALIHKHLKEVEDDEELEDIDDEWFESAEEVDGGRSSPNCIYGNEYLTCVRMFEGGGATAASTLLYESMFGNNEKPVHVTCRVGNVNGEGLIMVMPSEEGGLARSVVVMLAEDQLTKLTNHKSILQLHPTIILSSARRCS